MARLVLVAFFAFLACTSEMSTVNAAFVSRDSLGHSSDTSPNVDYFIQLRAGCHESFSVSGCQFFPTTCDLGYEPKTCDGKGFGASRTYTHVCSACPAGTEDSRSTNPNQVCQGTLDGVVWITTCKPCASGTFSLAGSTKCTTCSSCPSGKMVLQACTSTNDTVCEGCENCAAQGKPTITPCTNSDRGTCRDCKICASEGKLTASPCTSLADAVCRDCSTTCPAGSQKIKDCNATANVDIGCSSCVAGTTYNDVPTTSTTACKPCTTCPTNKLTTACTRTSNTVCRDCTVCPAGSYQSVACDFNLNTDTICEPCPPLFWKNLPGPSVCSACTVCEHGVETACTGSSDTVCKGAPVTPAGDSGIPWWVWLIVGIVAFIVIVAFIIWKWGKDIKKRWRAWRERDQEELQQSSDELGHDHKASHGKHHQKKKSGPQPHQLSPKSSSGNSH